MVFSTTLPAEVEADEKESYSSGEDSFVIINEEPETENAGDVVDTDQGIPKTEACDSGDVNINRETLENEIHEAIRQAGLDDKFWMKKIRKEFKVETVEELKNVTREQIEVFLQNTETTIQSFLRPVFSNFIGVDLSSRETVNCEPVDVEHVKLEMKSSKKVDARRTDEAECENTTEYPIRVACTEVGTNKNVEMISTQDDREGNSTAEQTSAISNQVEVLLQSIEALDQGSVHNILADSLATSISVTEVVRSLKNSVVCRGIYFTEDVSKLVEDREMVTNVSDDVVFSGAHSEQPLYYREFTSRESLRMFSNHIDKSVSAVSIGMNIFGIDLPDTVSCADAADSFVSCVHYQLVPAVSVQLPPQQMDLRPEVISALQNVEQMLKLSDYLPGNHFDGFFEKYGSHFCGGVVEFGGILVSIAECSGFKEEDHLKMAHMVTKASEMAFFLGFDGKIQPGKLYTADQVLGDVPDILSENITVTIKKIGGSQDTEEKDKWRQKLLEEGDKQWRVISRRSPPSGIWEMLQKYPEQFEDHRKLAESMMKEWGKNVRPKRSQR